MNIQIDIRIFDVIAILKKPNEILTGAGRTFSADKSPPRHSASRAAGAGCQDICAYANPCGRLGYGKPTRPGRKIEQGAAAA